MEAAPLAGDGLDGGADEHGFEDDVGVVVGVGEGEHVVDEAAEAGGLGLDIGDGVVAGGAVDEAAAVAEDAGVAVDHGDRRAELVGDEAEEVLAGAGGALVGGLCLDHGGDVVVGDDDAGAPASRKAAMRTRNQRSWVALWQG